MERAQQYGQQQMLILLLAHQHELDSALYVFWVVQPCKRPVVWYSRATRQRHHNK